MKKRVIIIAFVAIVLSFSNLIYAENEALHGVIRGIARKELGVLIERTEIVEAVKKANQSADRSFEEIIRLDNKWRTAKGINEWMSLFLDNPTAVCLREFMSLSEIDGKILYSEVFVTDKQGCIVAAARRTTDYWQGDEDKFIITFANKKGNAFVERPSFDESSLSYSIQVSLPIFDPGTEEAIGVITAGIHLDVLAERILAH